MTTPADDYYLKHKEPIQGCLLALKYLIMKVDKNITHQMLYQIPLFSYKGNRLVFLWVTKKKLLLGFVTDRSILPLINGKKQKDQYEMLTIDPNADLPKEMIVEKLTRNIRLYQGLNK